MDSKNSVKEKCFKCDHCGEQFSCEKSLRRHIQINHSLGRQDDCDFEQVEALESDSKRQGKPYHCSLCSSKYSCEISLKRHVQLCHVQELKNNSEIRVYEYYKDVSCPLCGKKLYSKWSLKIHLKRNHANGCNLCSLRFTSENC